MKLKSVNPVCQTLSESLLVTVLNVVMLLNPFHVAGLKNIDKMLSYYGVAQKNHWKRNLKMFCLFRQNYLTKFPQIILMDV